MKDHLSIPFFWKNQRITARRVGDILRKIRQRGLSWLIGRVKKEFRTPETAEGVLVRAIWVSLCNAAVFLLSPILCLASVLLWRNRKTLFYFYDLDVSPITFDFVDYLVLADLERRRRGLEHVYVHIVPGRLEGLRDEGEAYEKVVDRSARMWRLNNLVIPLMALVPSCSGYSVCKDRWQATLFRVLARGRAFPSSYWPAFPVGLFRRPILEAARQGTAVLPVLRSPRQSLRYVQRWLSARIGRRKPVTITLRQYLFDPMRNSNIRAWADFARSLDPEEFAPIFVMDTEAAMDAVPSEIEGFPIFAEGPWNVALRSALYELAYLNLALVHGPTSLLWYNDRCRYVIFFPRGYSARTDPEFMKANGFIFGESLPFATPFQKWVWESDDLSNIQREFARMCEIIENAVEAPERVI